MFNAADIGESVSYRPEAFDLLKELILYDMLRLYVKMYFSVRFGVESGHEMPQVDEWPQAFDEGDIDGLDRAQRDLIYDRFGDGKIPWRNDPTRPAINGYRDMIKYWGGKVDAYTFFRPDTPR
jgi:hypothetical protein